MYQHKLLLMCTGCSGGRSTTLMEERLYFVHNFIKSCWPFLKNDITNSVTFEWPKQQSAFPEVPFTGDLSLLITSSGLAGPARVRISVWLPLSFILTWWHCTLISVKKGFLLEVLQTICDEERVLGTTGEGCYRSQYATKSLQYAKWGVSSTLLYFTNFPSRGLVLLDRPTSSGWELQLFHVLAHSWIVTLWHKMPARLMGVT